MAHRCDAYDGWKYTKQEVNGKPLQIAAPPSSSVKIWFLDLTCDLR